MLRAIEGTRSFPHDPSARGYLFVYQMGETNRCPGCGRSHWHIGRISAECGFCGTTLALADTGMTGVGVLRRPQRERSDDAVFDEAA